MRNVLRVLQAGFVATSMLVVGTAYGADDKGGEAKPKGKVANAIKEVNQDINEALLASKVRMSLLKSLKGADALRVVLSVQGTTATLSGEVEERASVKVASEAAKSVEGVTAVHSTITHNPKAPHQGDFEAKVKDSILAAEVRLSLLQEVGKAAVGLHITATDGVVSLRGEMPNNTTRNQAVEKVKGMSNVKRVEDLMTTTP